MFNHIIAEFRAVQNPEKAVAMAAYMKNHFPFLGLSRPVRNSLQKEFIKKARKEKEINWEFVFRSSRYVYTAKP